VSKKLLFVVNVDWFFQSHRLPIALAAMKAGYEVHLATGITDKRAELEEQGLTVHPLGLARGGIGFLNAVWTLKGLLRMVRSVKPDVMHLVTIKPVLLGGLVARWAGVPALVTAVSGLGYVFMANGLKFRLLRRLVGFVYALALGHKNQTVIFQNADDSATLAAATGLVQGKTKLIRGSGVDLTSFTVQPLPEGPPVVMLAARLLADKGVREFVEAAAAVRKHYGVGGPVVRFVLVGEPDVQNPASLKQAELDAWQAAGLVELWGHRTDMHAVLSCATLVVLPSYREGLPKVLIEAAACGRAVVTTDVPGCRDAIEPGVTGLLVPAKNAAALADAVVELLANTPRCLAMGTAGRRLAMQAFDVNSVAEQHLAIYADLLAKAGQ
jgi:glycosyltransferase involved in cell wall biosynthesis